MYSHVFWHARWVVHVDLTYIHFCFKSIFFFGCNFLLMYMHKRWIYIIFLFTFTILRMTKHEANIYIWYLILKSLFYYSIHVYTTCNKCMFFLTEIDIQRCVQDSIKIFCSTPKSATFRQHAREPNKPSSSRPNISYYSRDYNEQPKSELVKPSTHCNCTERWIKQGVNCMSYYYCN